MSNAESGHLDGRHFSELNREDLSRALDAIEQYFGKDWIEANSAHPVGKLWLLKDDFLATNELYWLGEAIVRLAPINDKWVRETIEKIKIGDRGNRIGFTFELLSLASIVVESQDVRPASHGTKTFDADASLSDGYNYKVSIKNFGASSNDQRFQQKAQEIGDLIKAEARTQGKIWIGVMIGAEGYPNDKNWNDLNDALPELIAREKSLGNGFWGVAFQKTPPPTTNGLYAGEVSYNILIVARFDPNEANNYVRKVIEACTELDAAAARLGTEERCVVLIRLSENAPLTLVSAELQNTVDEDRRRLFGALLYQSAIAVTKNDRTALHHNMAAVVRSGYEGANIQYKVPVGVVSQNPSRQTVRIDGKELPADGYHMYQRRKVYWEFRILEKGGELTYSAQPGSEDIAVLVSHDGQSLEFRMGHADHTEVILFS